MRIGYSFWGFLGPGITDTPDGGRSHRRTLIDGLIARRARHRVPPAPTGTWTKPGTTCAAATPGTTGCRTIDALFLEWRWPIPGRNTTACGSPGHTCDLHRQDELLARYTLGHRLPTIVWDKDLQLPAATRRCGRMPSVTVCEAALAPSPGAVSLLFPVADAVLDAADPARAGRDAPAAAAGLRRATSTTATRRSAGSSPRRRALRAPGRREMDPHRGTGRTSTSPAAAPSPTSDELYESALATVLLLPERYARAGQMTQRLFEAVLAGCLPITPAAHPVRCRVHARRHCMPPTGSRSPTASRELHGIAGTACARRAHRRAAWTGSASSGCPASSPSSTTILGRLTDATAACLRHPGEPPAARVVARGPDRDHRLRRQRQVPPGPRTGRARSASRPCTWTPCTTTRTGSRWTKEQFAALQRDLVGRAAVDHRRQLRLHPADPPGRPPTR